MYIAQYYADSASKKQHIEAMAVMLKCQYRAVENIITVQINNKETLEKLKNSEWPPWTIQDVMTL